MSRGTYSFVSDFDDTWMHEGVQYALTIRQQPRLARVCNAKERTPVDPPPIIQIKLATSTPEEAQRFLQSPNYFMCADVIGAQDYPSEQPLDAKQVLSGNKVSSLHRLKDIDNTDGGFFVFGDLSMNVIGAFRLKFNLYHVTSGQAVHLHSLVSDAFTVYTAKDFPGLSESTFLSRSFSDQGVKLRIRKEHRIQIKWNSISSQPRPPSPSQSSSGEKRKREPSVIAALESPALKSPRYEASSTRQPGYPSPTTPSTAPILTPLAPPLPPLRAKVTIATPTAPGMRDHSLSALLSPMAASAYPYPSPGWQPTPLATNAPPQHHPSQPQENTQAGARLGPAEPLLCPRPHTAPLVDHRSSLLEPASIAQALTPPPPKPPGMSLLPPPAFLLPEHNDARWKEKSPTYCGIATPHVFQDEVRRLLSASP
ncbi:uncharacterized protein VTP21DRAFT_841 [Calcarisporiella thermophila]|uniref:uncharacterized protein n=1 Tax=Calcarisporiella thermophila TaxID=911321 RepID=UPI003742F243